jgi:subtilisin family serine protease
MKETVRKNRVWGRAPGIALGILIVAFMLVGCAAAAPPAGIETYHGREVAANAVLVKFHAALPDDITIGQDLDDTERVGTAGVMRLHSRSRNTAALITALAARPDVAFVEPDYIVHAVETIPDDQYYSSLWGMAKISAPAAWDSWTGSDAQVTGVIDTGIDYTHPDLAANVWSAPDAYTVTIGDATITCPAGSHGFNALLNTCDPMDDNNHGTHVSGTIGAAGNNGIGVAGVNWNTEIIGAKFLNRRGYGSTSDAVDAISFLIQTRERFGSDANIRVLSNSWSGGGYSQALYEEIVHANSHDMLFVAAAGNDGVNSDEVAVYPAGYTAANVVAVAATDSGDTLASWSNYGATSVDLAAPGVSIVSTVRGGYATYSGTSMATPHVSGAAALILSACSLDTAQLRNTILTNVDPVPSLVGKTKYGGRLNVFSAISSCAAPRDPTTTALAVAPDSSTYGDKVTFTATVSPSAATGTVTFSDGAVTLGTSALNTGVATYSVSGLPAGTRSITATYSGDGSYQASSDVESCTVNKAGSATVLASSQNPSTEGQTVTFTATVSPSAATGTVKFWDGGSVQLGTSSLNAAGVATYSTSGLTAGDHSITAEYSGDGNYTTSTSLPVIQTVNEAPVPAGDFSLSASPSSQTINPGGSTSYTVYITRTAGFAEPVDLSVSGLPAGASGIFSHDPTTGTSSTLTITTLTTIKTKTYPLTITGTSGSLTHSTTVSLSVKRAR